LRLQTVVFDSFLLDGGAMFGAVPKTLWSRLTFPDDFNRIKLVTRCLLLTGENRKILIDAGVGRMWEPKHYQYYDFRHFIDPSDISGVTDVIITHFHFDHAGGLVSQQSPDQVILSFPNAIHHCHRTNWEQALSPSPRERASYLSTYLTPLQSASINLLVDETSSIAGIANGHVVNGHTEGLMWISLKVGDTTFAFPSDLIPTSHHVSLPYIMGYDMCPRATLKEKELFLTKAAENSWVVIFQHDPDVAAATIARSAKGDFAVKQVIFVDQYHSGI
jgi:glyoxylase-like metal-dependent hydrolase (beta-lactamase superfamily II)